MCLLFGAFERTWRADGLLAGEYSGDSIDEGSGLGKGSSQAVLGDVGKSDGWAGVVCWSAS